IVLFLGGDPQALLQNMQQNAPPGAQQQGPIDPKEEPLVEFVKTILASTEDVWTDVFRQQGKQYRQPKLVLFSGQVESACGYANAAVGPFYCPADSKVYIDLQFYSDLQNRFNAAGDFAQAYVIAHEVGHHVQNELGISERVHRARQGLPEAEANELSVRQELQADFFAGIWAHHADRARRIMEKGDLEEGLRAASAIGDDRLQMQSRGYVVPEKFTHGTSEQRVRWFRRGFESGDMKLGDTFSARDL
ncbi:MAG: neutral zinc metallopeptidase, partial [Planctomycetaceae bacterium]